MIRQRDSKTGMTTSATETDAFLRWWKDHPERRLCTLREALGAYLQTFPGRIIPLLHELLCKISTD